MKSSHVWQRTLRTYKLLYTNYFSAPLPLILLYHKYLTQQLMGREIWALFPVSLFGFPAIKPFLSAIDHCLGIWSFHCADGNSPLVPLQSELQVEQIRTEWGRTGNPNPRWVFFGDISCYILTSTLINCEVAKRYLYYQSIWLASLLNLILRLLN